MSDTGFDITFADAELRQLADSLPLSAGDPTGPKRRADRRSRHSRLALGGTLSAALLLGGIQLASMDRDPQEITLTAPETSLPEEVDIEADGMTSIPDLEFEPSISIQTLNTDGTIVGDEITFDIRSADIPINREPAFITASDDGTVYVLAPAPGQPESNSSSNTSGPQVIYSTADGENWFFAEQGAHSFVLLEALGDHLYAITHGEPEGQTMTYNFMSSSDGGLSWTEAPFTDLQFPSDTDLTGLIQSSFSLAEVDGVLVGVVQPAFGEAEARLYSQLGVEASQTTALEFLTDGVAVVDRTDCVQAVTDSMTPEESREICDNAPVLGQMTYAELGVSASSFSDAPYFGIRSTDGGETWDRIVLPVRVVSSANGLFAGSTLYDGHTHHSTDGLTWTEIDQPDPYAAITDTTIGGRLGSFRYRNVPDESGTEAGNTSETQEVYFGVSEDGLLWSETLIYSFDMASVLTLGAGPAATSAGAYMSVQLLSSSYDPEGDSPPDFSGVSQLFYSFNGYDWQVMEITGYEGSELTWVFMTQDTIGLTFELDDPPDRSAGSFTVIVTPAQP